MVSKLVLKIITSEFDFHWETHYLYENQVILKKRSPYIFPVRYKKGFNNLLKLKKQKNKLVKATLWI